MAAWRSIYFVRIFILSSVWTNFVNPAFGEDNGFTILFGSETTMKDLHQEVLEVKQNIHLNQQSLTNLHENYGNLLGSFKTLQSELGNRFDKMLENLKTSIASQLASQRQEAIAELKNSQQLWFKEDLKQYETNLVQLIKIELGKQQDNVQNWVQNKLNNIEQRINNQEFTQRKKFELQSEQIAEQFKQTVDSFKETLNEIIKPLKSEISAKLKNDSKDTNQNDKDSQRLSYKNFLTDSTGTTPVPVAVNSATLGRSSTSCDEAIKFNTNLASGGIYALELTDYNLTKPVLCLPDPNGGTAWLVIQRRIDGKQSFDLGWEEYEQGFGLLNADFFIGLDIIHKLMLPNKTIELWIQLGTSTGESPYEIYKNFVISSDRYKLEFVSGATGTAGDELTSVMGESFRTKDNKLLRRKNCAERQKSGWWYPSKGDFCGNGNLNRNWKDLTWGDWSDIIYTHMAIRHTDNPVEVNHTVFDYFDEFFSR